jgi:serine/threonine protein kinase
MPPPTTADEYLDLVRKSAVVEDKKLGQFLEQYQGERALPREPQQLADVLIRDGVLTHFQAEQFLQGKWRRFSIGKYRVMERLGSGGMGNVFLCEHTLMRRRVAVKVLPVARASDPASLERFYREARCVAALDHPNLVHAYDIGEDEKLHFLVLEYVDGASLQELVRNVGPLDPIRTAHYIAQAAQGLQHAYQCASLVHRDIKPSNILVDRLGTVKILDLGLARFFNDEEDVLTKKYDENVLGTADYLAPEQALDSHSVDIRADIYSLGATAYFCLTGQPPFTEGSVAQKLVWHQTRQPKPLASFRGDIPAELIAVIEKMMAKEPDNRYSTPQAVVDAMVSWTRMPLDPPTEAEMPLRSPATRRLPVSQDDKAAGQGSSDHSPGPHTQSASPSSARGLSASGSGSSPSTANAKQKGTKPIRRSMAVPTVPAAATPPPKLGSAAPKKSEPVARPGSTAGRPPLPTGPAPVRPAVSPKTSGDLASLRDRFALPPLGSKPTAGPAKAATATLPQEQLPIWRRLLVLVGFIVVAVAIFCLGMMFFSGCAASPGWTVKGSSSEDASSSGPVLIVSKTDPNAYASLQKAIEAAGPGSHIRLKDPVLQEQVRPDRSAIRVRTWDPPIVIEPDGDGPVTWTAPANGPADQPLLVIEGLGGLQFRNIVLDGDNRVQVGIQLMAVCPGVVLENLKFTGFTQREVETWSSAGTKDKPIQLLNLKVNLSQPRDSASLSFRYQKDIRDTERTQHFIVRGCRFEGPFKSAPVSFEGNIGDMTWSDNVWVSPDGEKTITEPK